MYFTKSIHVYYVSFYSKVNEIVTHTLYIALYLQRFDYHFRIQKAGLYSGVFANWSDFTWIPNVSIRISATFKDRVCGLSSYSIKRFGGWLHILIMKEIHVVRCTHAKKD